MSKKKLGIFIGCTNLRGEKSVSRFSPPTTNWQDSSERSSIPIIIKPGTNFQLSIGKYIRKKFTGGIFHRGLFVINKTRPLISKYGYVKRDYRREPVTNYPAHFPIRLLSRDYKTEKTRDERGGGGGGVGSKGGKERRKRENRRWTGASLSTWNRVWCRKSWKFVKRPPLWVKFKVKRS